MPPKLGILAGNGDLPRQLIAACEAQGREIFVIAFEGHTVPEPVAAAPHCWVRLGAVGRLIRELKAVGARQLVMAGGMARPSWRNVKPDWRGLKMLPKVLAAAQGDDSILSLVIRELESEGFEVIGIQDIMGELLAPDGTLGRVAPDESARADIERAIAVARALGAVDVGQAVVVQQGVVLGLEAAEGTDALLARCAGLRLDGPGGVLLKLRKPGQESRADLPTIGAATVANAEKAGLRGIAVEAGATLIIDRDAVRRAADTAGLFVSGLRIDR